MPTTGALLWATQIHPDLRGAMTGSPILVSHTIITGVSANKCQRVPSATFRGDDRRPRSPRPARSSGGAYSLPDNHGVAGAYAGATMFSLAYRGREATASCYGTFGQALYRKPASVLGLQRRLAHRVLQRVMRATGRLLEVDRRLQASDTGAAVWSYRVFGDPPTQSACGPASLCHGAPPASDVEKWDVGGSSPNVFQLGTRTVVGFGGKSGVYYLFDARTGALLWNTVVGPGGDQGGLQWGTAYDGQRIYGSLTNQHHIPYRLTQNGTLTSTTVSGGSWAALDPATGRILWQSADPQSETLPAPIGTVGVWDLAPVSVANASIRGLDGPAGQLVALEGTGNIVWAFAAGSSVNAAPAVVNGSVYWGSGYARSAEGSWQQQALTPSASAGWSTRQRRPRRSR